MAQDMYVERPQECFLATSKTEEWKNLLAWKPNWKTANHFGDQQHSWEFISQKIIKDITSWDCSNNLSAGQSDHVCELSFLKFKLNT